MRLKYNFKALHPAFWFHKLSSKLTNKESSLTAPSEPPTRMGRKKQKHESKIDTYMYRASLISFATICLMLALIPIVYFLPWEQMAEWFVFLLLGALFVSFTLSAITVKKQSKYVKLPYMWGIMLVSILLLCFYLSVLIYFRFFLVT